jgi:hypothetical protein
MDLESFLSRFPVNREALVCRVDLYVRDRLMERDGRGNIRLTGQGMVIADEIMGELAMEVE